MYAVIHKVESVCTHGLIPIADRPLVARQVQWLRSIGCKGIAVQIGVSAESVALGQWLARRDAIGAAVRLVMSGDALSPRAIARRAGFPDDAPLLAIPEDVLCGGDIKAILRHAKSEGALVSLDPPPALEWSHDECTVRVFGSVNVQKPTGANGAWGIRIRTLADAFAVSVSVLEGRLPQRSENGILLHASERGRGIWCSRGAHVDPSAKIIPPVLLGLDTVVRAHAVVGPRVFLGARSVIEQGTHIEDAMVAPGTIVGENLALSCIAIDPRGTQDLFTGEHATIDETLLLTNRDKPHRGNIFGRCIAALLLTLMSPIIVLAYMITVIRGNPDNPGVLVPLSRKLTEAARGNLTFVGLSTWTEESTTGASMALLSKALAAPVGLIPIDRALLPTHANTAMRLRARVYYAHQKNTLLDFVLILRCLRQTLTRQTPDTDRNESPSPMKALS